jgi:hypothetical protein
MLDMRTESYVKLTIELGNCSVGLRNRSHRMSGEVYTKPEAWPNKIHRC